MRLFLRVLGLVLGSVFFIPVSCTGAMVGALSVHWPWNQYDLSAGQKVPYGFPVMLSIADGSVRGIALDDLADELARTPGGTLLLRKPKGDFDDENYESYRWQVESSTPTEQTIALSMMEEDLTWNVRYVARADGVRPLEAHYTTPSDLFIWFPASLVVALVVWYTGRRIAKANAPPPPVAPPV